MEDNDIKAMFDEELENYREEKKKSQAEKELYYKLLTDDNSADKANEVIEAHENLKRAERIFLDTLKPNRAERSVGKRFKPDTMPMGENEGDIIFSPREKEKKYPAISDGVKNLLKEAIKTFEEENRKQKLVWYDVNREMLMDRLKKDAVRRAKDAKRGDMTRWWRAVYEWLKKKGILRLNEDTKEPRPKWLEFATSVVCYCLPDEEPDKVKENILRKEVKYEVFTNEVEMLLSPALVKRT